MASRWSLKEIEILKNNIEANSVTKLMEFLPERTYHGIAEMKRKLQLKVGPRKLYQINKTFFKEYSLLSSYWAGFLAADGCIKEKEHQISLRLAATDREHVILFAKTMGHNGDLKTNTEKRKLLPHLAEKEYSNVNVNICGKELVNDLWLNYNIGAKKSLTLEPPIQITNFDVKLPFIIGYIDGDGTISLSQSNRISLAVIGTEKMILWIKDIIDILVPPIGHFNPQVNIEKQNSKIFRYKVTGNRALKILRILNDISVPKLKRKWDKVGFAIEPIYRNDYLSNSLSVKRAGRKFG